MNKFVIVYDDNTVRSVSENIVSKMYDLADCDYMDNVRDIYAADEKGRLVPVEIGESRKYNDWDAAETTYYASAPIKAGKRTIGFIHYSNH